MKDYREILKTQISKLRDVILKDKLYEPFYLK